MKLFCTGNPKKRTVAYALGCDHASLSSGWNFRSETALEKFSSTIVNYDVFINSAWISPGIQIKLMDIAYKAWMANNIKGHIINIGTTLENTDDQSEYAVGKRKLRKRSLELSDQTGITGVKTTHLILGGIDNGESDGQGMVKLDQLSSSIHWVVAQECRVPLLQLDGVK
tara:strand:+ start:1556 stop:2065 length:510 start_codon:yes stop_codon:yes gene_type:complete